MRRDQGFTLVEMAMVITIIGIILSMGLSFYTSQNERVRYELSKNVLEEAKEALARYVKDNGYLPCPAPLNVDISAPSFGQDIVVQAPGAGDDCAVTVAAGTFLVGGGPNQVRIGALPIRQLALSDTLSYDGFGNRLIYAVRPALASMDDETAARTRFAVPATLGNLRVLNNVVANGGVSVTGPEDAAFIVLSLGKDHLCAYDSLTGIMQGNPTDCTTGPPERRKENGDYNNGTFIDTVLYNTEQPDRYYDDFAVWMLKRDLASTAPVSGDGDGAVLEITKVTTCTVTNPITGVCLSSSTDNVISTYTENITTPPFPTTQTYAKYHLTPISLGGASWGTATAANVTVPAGYDAVKVTLNLRMQGINNTWTVVTSGCLPPVLPRCRVEGVESNIIFPPPPAYDEACNSREIYADQTLSRKVTPGTDIYFRCDCVTFTNINTFMPNTICPTVSGSITIEKP